MGGDDDHRHFKPFLTQAREQRDSVHARHAHVGDDQIDGVFEGQFQRLLAVARGKDRVPHFVQHDLEKPAHVRLVVGDENVSGVHDFSGST